MGLSSLLHSLKMVTWNLSWGSLIWETSRFSLESFRDTDLDDNCGGEKDSEILRNLKMNAAQEAFYQLSYLEREKLFKNPGGEPAPWLSG